MTITAAMVKELREKTGAGILDAKKALTENDGDMEKAMEYLRQKGIASAEKKMGRIAAEGLVGSCVEGNVGAMIEVNCETDFVAKNDEFKELGTTIKITKEHIQGVIIPVTTFYEGIRAIRKKIHSRDFAEAVAELQDWTTAIQETLEIIQRHVDINEFSFLSAGDDLKIILSLMDKIETIPASVHQISRQRTAFSSANHSVRPHSLVLSLPTALQQFQSSVPHTSIWSTSTKSNQKTRCKE